LWVLRNPVTGRHFRASPRLYLLAASLDGRVKVSEAIAALPTAPAGSQDTEARLLEGIAGMIGAGLLLLPGARPPASPRRGFVHLLSGVAFTRVRFGDLGSALPVIGPLIGWLFRPAGALVLAALILGVALAWSGRRADLAEQIARLAQLGFAELITGYLIFAAAKMLHEGGHAVALHRMLAAEGQRCPPISWGMSFMFLLPAPYVDASAAWFLASPRRRAIVGLAGVMIDLLVAALAALAWASLGPGAMRDRMFDLVLICSVSSLLFNLNPLVKLDGYYVLSDLTGVPNLMARAQSALGRIVFGPFGLATAPATGDVPLGIYALASWLYRWTIYLSIFWLAGGVHWLLAGGLAGVVAALFLVLPLMRLLMRAPGAVRAAPGRASVFAALLAAAILFVAVVPLPQNVVTQGVVVRQGLSLVFAPADGQVIGIAPAGPIGAEPVLRLENPDTARLLTQLRAEAAALAIEARRARATGAERVDAASERERAAARQIAALEAERAAWDITAPAAAVWEPLRAEMLAGGWVRRDDQRPLGAILAGGATTIHLVLDQWDGPAALGVIAADPLAGIPVRRRGGTEADILARPVGPALEARDSLPSPALAARAGGPVATRVDDRGQDRPIERVFELRLAPAGEIGLPHGARVEARLSLPPASLAAQVWRRARQALQRRLAL
jgi:putative peptide zinc metalloprotease protein